MPLHIKIALVAVAVAGSGSALLAAPTFPAEQLDFFERKIRPILADKCYRCHSVSAEKLKGELLLDRRDGLLKGGDNGPAIVPGVPADSPLIELIHYRDADMEMPPKSKLPDAVIADFETWIGDGAAWPEEETPTAKAGAEKFDLEARRASHWCWKPLDPAPRQPGFIDGLIRAKLAEAKLKPAAAADRATWIRRVTFDLIGLPPGPDEVAAFLADKSPQAFDKVVDRLLASPHFGERWARHWLDLVRYAESHGHEFDYPIHHATPYRDYVIRALNADVPYHRFAAEHIAGDLLPNPRRNPGDGTNESIIATGFWYLGEAVHGPTDARKDEADRMDNMIDVFSKSFLGLTVSCARCHDHKFDAISTADYYALTGYLQSTRRNEYRQDPGGKIATEIAKIAKIEAEGNRTLKKGKAQTAAAPASGESLLLPASSRWFTSGAAFGDAPVPALGWLPIANAVTDSPVYDSGRYGEKLSGVLRSPTFKLEGNRIHLYVKGDGAKVRLIIDGYFMEPFNGLLFGGTRQDIKTDGKWKWISLGGKIISQSPGQFAYLEISDPGAGSVAVKAVAISKDAPDINTIFPPDPRAGELQKAASRDMVNLSNKAKAISAAIPDPSTTILSVADGTPESGFVHIRGSHKKLGEEVPRRFLTALGGETVAPPTDASGRLELAKQVVSEKNPLTARVAANRIWHHLFGRGIVATVDDFGVMGIAPSHPKLLDTLASSLMENGWSQKALIRRIVLSDTYRQSAEPDASLDAGFLADTDPENILLHKAPVRRLQAEAIRDAMLAISGRLDRKLGGPSVPVHLTSFMQGRGRPRGGPLDGAGRRSIYISIRRNFLPPMMLAFDMPSPFSTMGRRTVSNVPAQALTLMNDPFVAAEAKRWAGSAKTIASPEERVGQMFLQAFSRPPTAMELEGILTWIKEHPDQRRVWQDLAHTLWNKKEFIFIN